MLQGDYTVRCEWGPRAVEALAPHCDVVVIVDVLSFSTSVDVATARGATVLPYPFRDASAARYAREHDALLAGANPDGYRLEPTSLMEIPSGTRLVLPSPNGSELSFAAASRARGRVLAGCLRNRSAVAAACEAAGGSVLVVPAGERWKDDATLRPAFEDHCGAGAVIDALPEGLSRSPEAEAAHQVFRAARDDLARRIAACASGREKTARDDAADLALASALDASRCVPLLGNGAYRDSSVTTSTRSG